MYLAKPESLPKYQEALKQVLEDVYESSVKRLRAKDFEVLVTNVNKIKISLTAFTSYGMLTYSTEVTYTEALKLIKELSILLHFKPNKFFRAKRADRKHVGIVIGTLRHWNCKAFGGSRVHKSNARLYIGQLPSKVAKKFDTVKLA